MDDLISRDSAYATVLAMYVRCDGDIEGYRDLMCESILVLPSAQPEPLTDKEQRIFLAAMSREEKVCEEVDRNYVHEPYEDSLMSVCKAIRRKVKDTLWT